MTKEELINKIQNNRSFDLRDSEFYEPWDISDEKIKDMADDFYYLLKDVLNYLAGKEEPVSEELEEAAWLYYDGNKPLMPQELDLHKELIDFFKAGVRWKEQNDSNLSKVLERDNLDEMVEEYSSCTYLKEVLGEGDREVLKARLKNTFKAGAKWQKEYMMKEIKIRLVDAATNQDKSTDVVEQTYYNGMVDALGRLRDKFMED